MKNYKDIKNYAVSTSSNVITLNFGRLNPEKLLFPDELAAFHDTINEIEQYDVIDVYEWNQIIKFLLYLRRKYHTNSSDKWKHKGKILAH